MKKLYSNIVLGICLLATLLSFTACFNSPVGTWKLEKIISGSNEYALGEQYQSVLTSGPAITLTEDSAVLVLNEDKTFTYSGEAYAVFSQSGTWAYGSNRTEIILTCIFANGDSSKISLTWQDNQIVVTRDRFSIFVLKKAEN